MVQCFSRTAASLFPDDSFGPLGLELCTTPGDLPGVWMGIELEIQQLGIA